MGKQIVLHRNTRIKGERGGERTMELIRSYRTRGKEPKIKVVIQSRTDEQGLEVCTAVRKALAKANRRLIADGGERLEYCIEVFRLIDQER